MDLQKLILERNTLQLALAQWDDLLSPKERATHAARSRVAAEIERYAELIRKCEAEELQKAA